MAREKATITVDRAKLERARVASGSATVSATVDRALDALLRAERIRRDVNAYLEFPQGAEEHALGVPTPGSGADLSDDTDWGRRTESAQRPSLIWTTASWSSAMR